MSIAWRILLGTFAAIVCAALVVLIARIGHPAAVAAIYSVASLIAAGSLIHPLTFRLATTERAATEARSSKIESDQTARVRAEFLANMSHELRTPLNGILGMTELVLDTDLTPQQREYLAMLQSSAESLLRLVNDILDYSKGNAGKLVLDPVDFSLRESLSETLNPLAVRTQGKGLELAYHVQPRVPDSLVGDNHRLKQILINLVGNAIKFTDAGEIVVRTALESRDGQYVRLHFSVADTGIGIPNDKLARLFQPFEQADASTARKFGGTGLGLAISRQLADLMGGRLWVESEAGKGSTFHFEAPFQVGTGATSSTRRTQLGLIPDLPVLVVDDSEVSRKILEEMLLHWQTAPELVADPARAISTLDRARSGGRKFGVVLIDSDLPGSDAFQLCEQVCRHPIHGRVPVVMLTPANRPAHVARALASGAVTTLLKPVKPSKLARAIVTAVLGADRSLPSTIAAEAEPAASDEPSLPPLRILLAEDNEINQKFATRVLEGGGHAVVVAGNGNAVVELANRDLFDVVLMDVQMPELDGLSACQEIRRRHADRNRRLPIIAMTANATAEDKAKCLDAGMDGYVAKPVRSALLFAEIQRVLAESAPPGGSQAAIAPSSTGTSTRENAPFPPEVFDSAAFLANNDGSLEFLAEVRDMFAEDRVRLQQAIQSAAAQNDAAALAAAAHTVKGMVGNFHAQAAASAAANLESLGRQGKLTGVDQAIARLEMELRRLEVALESFLEAARIPKES
jgi:signal transduction histidine kinase/DNA-binding response OmpR family regulator